MQVIFVNYSQRNPWEDFLLQNGRHRASWSFGSKNESISADSGSDFKGFEAEEVQIRRGGEFKWTGTIILPANDRENAAKYSLIEKMADPTHQCPG